MGWRNYELSTTYITAGPPCPALRLIVMLSLSTRRRISVAAPLGRDLGYSTNDNT